jgi:hypothetical protein
VPLSQRALAYNDTSFSFAPKENRLPVLLGSRVR